MDMNNEYTTYDNGGRKDNKGKLDYTLLPWICVDEVVKVLMHGADKYDRFNWMKVPQQEYAKAAFRHIIADQKGEMCDKESGLPHLAHAVCCLLFQMHADTEMVGEVWPAPPDDDGQLMLGFEDDDPYADTFDDYDDLFEDDALYIGSCK
jgi:hypothetical protein